jgi:hypothetical protein
MANRFANGAKAFGFCDYCNFRFPLKKLKNEVVKTKQTQIRACPQCWSMDHPQLQLGLYPVSDPQAIRDPRPDTNTWYQSGANGLQTTPVSGLLPANPFTSNGTAIIVVNAPNHGIVTGDYATFSGAVVFNGATIVGQYQVTVLNANSYTITYNTTVAAGVGGGSAVTFSYTPTTGNTQNGFPGEGMLVIQWGWNPIGGAQGFVDPLTPNTLVGKGEVGTVTITDTGTPKFTLVETLYTTPGTYSWTAPAGVTSIYVLCIGGGGCGGYNGGVTINGNRSSFNNPLFFADRGLRGSLSAGAGGGGTALGVNVFGGNGGNGGPSSTVGSPIAVGGGGGTGGYAGNGGRGGSDNSLIGARLDGSGGAGAGGSPALLSAVGGGGVGINGVGANGVGDGVGGSGGTNGTNTGGGVYGAGGGGKRANTSSSGSGGGGGGGLRWTPALAVISGTAYPIIVGAGGASGVANPGGDGAVKIAYWLPVP